MAPISKSTFLQFQICPKDTWLRLHKSELVEQFVLIESEKHLLGRVLINRAWLVRA
jgi:hypothetical protein